VTFSKRDATNYVPAITASCLFVSKGNPRADLHFAAEKLRLISRSMGSLFTSSCFRRVHVLFTLFVFACA